MPTLFGVDSIIIFDINIFYIYLVPKFKY